MLENKLIEFVKKLDGKLVVFGVNDSKIIDCIDNNNNIVFCDLLNCNCNGKSKKGHKKYIKSIKKKYKKKRIDNMIIDLDSSFIFMRKVLKDSIYITKNNIYLYGDMDSILLIIDKYKRYNVKINKLDYKNKSLLIIDVKNAKNNLIKDQLYYIMDTLSFIVDKIGDLMSSN